MNRRQFIEITLTLPIVSSLSLRAFATTWTEKEFDCPVCSTKNTFRVIMSYGSYIYDWPSKYQLIYWPVTDQNFVYCCKKCRLATFLWDYEDLAKEKIPIVKKQLETVSIKNSHNDYALIPMTQRLEVAEKVYSVLGQNDVFWCYFYRISGYHYANEQIVDKADSARRKALELSQKLLNEKNNEISSKELLVISGAMKHFLKDDEGAIANLNQALKEKFISSKLTADENNNSEKNLNALVKEYITKIKSIKPPRNDTQ